MIDGVERAAGEWMRNGRQSAWLDHRGERLSAAERVATREDFRKRLGEEGLPILKRVASMRRRSARKSWPC